MSSAQSTANFSDNLSTLSYVPKRCMPSWFYDHKTGALLGRTGKQWMLLLLFYTVFYALLAGLFFGMLAVFVRFIIPIDQPYRTGYNSLLKSSPGVSIRPMLDLKSAIIRYSSNDPQTYEPLVQKLDAYFDGYYSLSQKPQDVFASCENGKKTPEDPSKVCRFDLAKLGPCNKDQKYGYLGKKPCVFVKMNKVFGWLPEITNTSVPHPLVKCFGQNPLDKTTIGELKYYPEVTFGGQKYGFYDNSFFPYIGQPGYVQPVVAVEFTSIMPYVTVLIECEVFNLKTSINQNVKFELQVD